MQWTWTGKFQNSDVKEPAFKLKSLSQDNFATWTMLAAAVGMAGWAINKPGGVK